MVPIKRKFKKFGARLPFGRKWYMLPEEKQRLEGECQAMGKQKYTMSVKVEVHSSSSGAGSDENLSSSDLSERSGDHEHDYEDIYLVREESNKKGLEAKERKNSRSQSRDSGSHSRSGSVSSSNSGCNVVVKVTNGKEEKNPPFKTNEFLPKPQKIEKIERKVVKEEEENKISSHNKNDHQPSSIQPPSSLQVPPSPEQASSSPSSSPSGSQHQRYPQPSPDASPKSKLTTRHSLPPPKVESAIPLRPLQRLESAPPPPPPLPLVMPAPEDDEPRGAEIVEVVEEPTIRPSDVVKGMCSSMSALSARRLNSSCSDLTIVSLDPETISGGGTISSSGGVSGVNLVNKQRVLPFVPPSFPGSNSNNLIKPSEYLRSISDKRSSVSSSRSISESEDGGPPLQNGWQSRPAVPTLEDRNEGGVGPPPPPLPDFQENGGTEKNAVEPTTRRQDQPLSAISIQDLNSVQLKRTLGDKTIASKTFSAPTRSMSLQCLQSEPYLAQKTDLIAELKMSRDIVGIKKLKMERAKTEESKEKEIFTEISRQFTTTRFVDKVPEKDNTGNLIPAWKRQMLAKKAAEKARKELEEQLLREAEEKRLQAIPQWKRQLLMRKEEAENRMRNTLYTPKVVDEPKVAKIHDVSGATKENQPTPEETTKDDNNNEQTTKQETSSASDSNEQSEEEPVNIIPWRAQLRKTNSKLNLLE
ncbi:unnamed protein product [Callosobruchus maculatus]|uniref:Uncharacterized protein n=1 Tax=Callosobruchus maculatus TaxID=64391 RepID=A0A653D0Z9_CALMS|nr:unnamed protein product [Callosobruchus maculatus]